MLKVATSPDGTEQLRGSGSTSNLFTAHAEARGNQYGEEYRNYGAEAVVRACVLENYRLNHIHQTHEFAKHQAEKFGTLNRWSATIWEAMHLLNEVVDESDPDVEVPQIVHCFQTAEALRQQHPDHDWLHLTGLIHDVGKVLAHPKFGSQPQWAVVGDTFPTGCAHAPEIVYNKHFAGNPDTKDPALSSLHGVYSPGCGLVNTVMSWGHDEYMYQVAKAAGTTLPEAGMYIIRFHSFYSMHEKGAYTHLMDDLDRQMLPWVKAFQKCDLYSKCTDVMDIKALTPYYDSLIDKYFPNKTLKW